MINVKESIDNLVDFIMDDENVLRYVYNDQDEFIPFETPIYYSVPYWD